MIGQVLNFNRTLLNVRGLPTTTRAYPPAVWETMVTALEDAGLVGSTVCAFCEGEPGWHGDIEHAEGCPFEAIDQAMADYHQNRRAR